MSMADAVNNIETFDIVLDTPISDIELNIGEVVQVESEGSVQPVQEKSINITKNGSVAVTPDSGYLLSKVSVNVNVASSGGENKNNTFIDFSRFVSGAYLYRLISSIDLSSFDTSNATNMENMFNNLSNLTSLDLSSFVTSNVTNMGYMFYSCSKLTSLDLSSFDTSKVTGMGNMFYRCTMLQTLILGNNWASNSSIASFDLSPCSALSHDSLVDIMNKLATRTNSPKIKLSTASKNLLTDDEKAIATGKGWTIA